MTRGGGMHTEPEAVQAGGKGRWSWLASKWLRLLVSAVLLAFVISRVDRRQLGPILSSIDLRLLVLAQMANFVMLGLNTLRWWILLRAQGTRISFWLAGYYYFFGAFFNSFMPTSVGGDLVRVVAASEHTGRKSVTLASVFVERLLGFFTLVPVSLIGIALTFREFRSPRLLWVMELLALAVFVAMGVVLNERVARGILRLFRPVFSLIPRLELESRLGSVYEAVRLYGTKHGVLVVGFLISMVSRAVWIFGCYLVAVGLGMASVTMARLYTVIPLVELARMAPISLGGLGVREGTFAGLMSQYGVASTPAILLSFLFYLLSLVNGLVGGALYLVRTLVRKA